MTPTTTRTDPAPQDWAAMPLPGSWVDDLNLYNPADLLRFLRPMLGSLRPVELPPDLPGRDKLPAYLLQEFHLMPNGAYSKDVADGYRKWFDLSMLGEMSKARRRIVERLAGARAALDLGCGAGQLAGALRASGIPDVWGLEPCPYLLKESSATVTDVRFVQGLAEESPFADERFDAVAACFLFHELPSEVADRALDEVRRIMKRGGRLVICEPSPLQMEQNLLRLLRAGGLKGLYFKLLALFLHEPFVREWHRREPTDWLPVHGFDVLEDEIGMPMRMISARKR